MLSYGKNPESLSSGLVLVLGHDRQTELR